MHTKGPWMDSKIPKGYACIKIVADGPRAICEIHTTDLNPRRAEDYANAALICAAPELLEAAKYVADYLNAADLIYHHGSRDSNGESGQKVFSAAGFAERLNAAISKAEGGEK